MDIVSRLKRFMEQENIAISQFADTCRIPRPTMSQILNGRNKKISDELISKIHLAYPELSVLWLMFSEGDMMTSANIAISAPEISSQTTSQFTHNAEQENDTSFPHPNATIQENHSKKQSDVKTEHFNDYFTKTADFSKSQSVETSTTTINFMPDYVKSDNSINHPTPPDFMKESENTSQQSHVSNSVLSNAHNQAAEALSEDTEKSRAADTPTTHNITLPTSPTKRITSIVVFYSDNSFQSFTPTS